MLTFFVAVFVNAFVVSAQTSAVLTLVPPSGEVVVGDVFDVAVTLDTRGQETDGVDIHYLHFDPSVLEVVDAGFDTAGIQIAAGSLYPSVVVNAVDNSAGTIDFSQIISGGNTFSGSGTLATISFRALAGGQADLTFDFTLDSGVDTNVAAAGQDILGEVSGASVRIDSGDALTVSITDTGFVPSEITADPGQTITWVNNDTVSHEIASDDHPTHDRFPALNVGVVAPGESVSVSFDAGGVYTYHDHLFPERTGSITVREVVVDSAQIVGVVTDGSFGGAVLLGVTATLSPGSKTTQTNSNGQYSFNDLSAGTYTLTLSKSGYTSYTSPSFSIAADEELAKNFYLRNSALQADGTISGRVSKDFFGDSGLGDVTVTLFPGGTKSVADANGMYSLSVPPGSYTLRFERNGYDSYITESIAVSEGVTTNRDFFVKRNCSGVSTGTLVKANNHSAVYYIDGQCRRNVFPHEKIYKSWYSDFSGVVTITPEALAQYSIGRNVTYRAGTRLIKIRTIPKVYAVGFDGSIHWIPTEERARALYGNDWSKRVDDVADTFFTDYTLGADIVDVAYPEGSLVQFAGDSVFYMLVNEGGELRKRKVHNTASFDANRFSRDFVLTVPSSVIFSDGADIARQEARFVKLVD